MFEAGAGDSVAGTVETEQLHLQMKLLISSVMIQQSMEL